MKKKMLLVPLALLLAVSLVVIGCPAPAPAVEPAPPPIELRFNSMYSPAHPINIYVFEVWAEEVEKRTDGRVKVTLFPASALAGPREAFDATIAGITDIAVSCPSYAPERFPLTSSVELPMLGPTATISSRVVWTIYEKFPEVRAEYAEVKLLWLYANPPTHLHFVRDPVHTLEDLKGLVISAGGKKTAEMVERLGAAVEIIPMVDVYLALKKGVVDGVALPYAPLRAQRIADIARHHTEVALGCHTFYVVMNLDKWNTLSPEDQEIIEEISGRWAAELSGSVFDKQ
ncbi:TRAP transporter substrate-binding protein, partial [Dehalococcoidia bacterium]|nr:TRAP transporter substrate-binding protein [Dehalococcoidia bacterium]